MLHTCSFCRDCEILWLHLQISVQEVTQRVLETVGGIAGSSLEQTSWLSRSLEVKVQPQVCSEAEDPDDTDMDGDHDGNFISL